MTLRLLSLFLAVAGPVLADIPLEQALARGDECQGPDGAAEDACALNALQVQIGRQSHEQVEESSCQPVNQWCGTTHAEKDCCDTQGGGGNQCVPDGNIFKCKPPQDVPPQNQWQPAPTQPAWQPAPPQPTPQESCDRDTGGTCIFAGCDASRGAGGAVQCLAGKCLCAEGMCNTNGVCQPPCKRDTGGTCLFGTCDSSRGAVQCVSGSCLCAEGLCNRDGKCCVATGSECGGKGRPEQPCCDPEKKCQAQWGGALKCV